MTCKELFDYHWPTVDVIGIMATYVGESYDAWYREEWKKVRKMSKSDIIFFFEKDSLDLVVNFDKQDYLELYIHNHVTGTAPGLMYCNMVFAVTALYCKAGLVLKNDQDIIDYTFDLENTQLLKEESRRRWAHNRKLFFPRLYDLEKRLKDDLTKSVSSRDK